MTFLSIVLFSAICSYNTKIVVSEFHKLETEQSEIAFIDKYKHCTNPSVMGYVLSIEMKQAKYRFNPVTKLAIFNKAKSSLDSLINNYSINIHLRYVRLVLQEQTPRILGYDDYLERDKDFLAGKLVEKDESDYLDYYIRKNTSL